MKKIGLLFTIVLMIMMFALSASALEPTGQCGDNVYWTFDEKLGELVINGSGDMFNFNKENSLFYSNNYPNAANIQKITIGKDITGIGDYAFYNCHSVRSIEIADSVTKIGDSAFNHCINLENITIPSSVISIGNYAFESCGFNSIVIPDGVATIGYRAFWSCYHLNSATIPASVTHMGDDLFYACPNLTGVIVDENNTKYSSDDRGVLFNKDKTFLFSYPMGNCATFYNIPNSVKDIDDLAFFDCASNSKLVSVSIPNGVTAIRATTFSNCSNLTSITIPNSVTYIGSHAFWSCNNLTDVFYSGTEELWSDIEIQEGNNDITEAIIHFSYDCFSHTYSPTTIPPTCETDGYTVYVCECGHSYISDKTPAIGHNYKGNSCSVCGESKIENCNCNCHKGGISGFFWKILRFFYKLFGTNKTCGCGVAHY